MSLLGIYTLTPANQSPELAVCAGMGISAAGNFLAVPTPDLHLKRVAPNVC